ncbi:MAG: ABC transporter permease [Gemmatimonadota bacterium]
MTGLAVLVLRLLLYLAPPAFRREFGAEIEGLFRRSIESDRGVAAVRRIARGWWGVVEVAVREWADPTSGRARFVGHHGGERGMHVKFSTVVAQAVRSVVRAPMVSAGVVGLLGLGIGATVTVLSVVDEVLIRALPYPESDRLVMVDEGAHSWPDYLDWRETVAAFDAVVAGSGFSFTLTGEVREHVEGARVSAGFYDLVGATAIIGRLPSDDEVEQGLQLAVVSHAAWERRWGGRPDLIGETLIINGEPVAVIGVLSPDFVPPTTIAGFADLYLPVGPSANLSRGDRSWTVLARLSPGATLADAREGLLGRARAFADMEPDLYLDERGELRRTFPPVSLREAIAGDARTPLLILLAGSGLLLAVAIGNASSLLLARGQARRREIAVRRALGAGSSIPAQLVVESLVLSAAGCALGLVGALGGIRLIQRFEPGDLPQVAELTIDPRVLGIAVLLTAVSGVVAGLVPALRSSRGKSGLLATANDRGSSRSTGPAIVVGEAMLASLLLVGSLTVVEGLRTLLDQDPGFSPELASVVTVDLGAAASEEERASSATLVQRRLSEWPGVTAVGAGVRVPFEVSGGSRCCWIGDLEHEGRELDLWVHPITTGYFTALNISLDAGREFTEDDGPMSTPVVVLNRSGAAELFPEGDAVGRRVVFADEVELEVVGVVGDVRHWGADQDIEPAFYVPFNPMGTWSSTLRFVVRGGDIPDLAAVRTEVAAIAPEAIVSNVGTMEGLMAESLARQWFYTLILTLFAVCALVLAMAGLGGTLLYDVRQRRRELGIRIALGQPARSIARGVLVRGAALVAMGATLGLGAYWPLRRFMDSLVPGMNALDPTALAAFLGVLLVAVLAASWGPARVVAGTDAAGALRADG